jgi:capsular exopolysaccharide synthesis family protein
MQNKEERREEGGSRYYGRQPYYGKAPYGEYGGMYYGGGEQDDNFLGEISLKRLIRVLRRKWLTISLSILFFATVAIIYLMTATKIYEAKSMIELSVRRPRVAGNAAAVIEDQGGVRSEEVFNTHLERFKGNTMFNLATEQYLEGNQPPFEDMEEGDVKSWLRKSSDFQLIRRSRLLTISFEDPDPLVAEAGANALARAAEQLAFVENRAASEQAVGWLKTQVEQQRKALEQIDQKLLKFRAENNLDVMDVQRRTVADAIMDYNKALVEVESQKVLSQELYDMLSTMEAQPDRSGQLPASTPRIEEIQRAMDKWITAQGELDKLMTKYTEKHPAVKAKVKESLSLRGQVVNAIRRSKQAAEMNLKLLQNQARGLERTLDEQRQAASDLEMRIIRARTEFAALEREKEAADLSYKSILNRIEEARLSADETTATVKVVEWAAPPKNPVKPRKIRVLAVMLFLGGVIGCGLALFTDTLEDHISSSADIETMLGLKVLGMVPKVYDVEERKDLAQLSMTDKFSQVAESFAGLRAILDSAQYRDFSNCVLVASTMPEEGKTITSCNLSIMSAKSGKKTLLIDMDLRRPRVGRIWGMPDDAPGLMQVLATDDYDSFSKLPFATACENLDVVGSRVMSNVSPAELLGGKCVREFLTWAQQNYDRVIIDSPPYGIVSDAVVFAGSAGCAVLVCRPGRSRKRAMGHAIQHFREVGANLIGAVVNDVDFKKDAYFSNYDHHYGHYGSNYNYKPDDSGKA